MDKLPISVKLTAALLRALNIKESLKLWKVVIYLYQEFYIKTKITPKIEHYTVQFSYKDNQLLQVKVKDLKELNQVIDTLKKSRGEIIK